MGVWQYLQSIPVTKSIKAVLFLLCRNRNADKVDLNSCTGWVRYIGRFPESKTYEFTLDGQLSGGDAGIILLDKNKDPLLKLNRQSPAGTIDLDGKGRYYLKWEFKNATGKCELRW